MAASGLVIYFIGAVLRHLLVGDFAGIGGAALMLVMAMILLTLRIEAGSRTRQIVA